MYNLKKYIKHWYNIDVQKTSLYLQNTNRLVSPTKWTKYKPESVLKPSLFKVLAKTGIESIKTNSPGEFS